MAKVSTLNCFLCLFSFNDNEFFNGFLMMSCITSLSSRWCKNTFSQAFPFEESTWLEKEINIFEILSNCIHSLNSPCTDLIKSFAVVMNLIELYGEKVWICFKSGQNCMFLAHIFVLIKFKELFCYHCFHYK